MSKLPIVNLRGDTIGEVGLADGWLCLHKGAQALHDVVVSHLAEIRAGTASTLGKGVVSGSGKKPWRQKGTGRARAGYRQSPIWRGGGVSFGPHPRSYHKKVSRKVARLAFRRAFSEKMVAGEVKILQDLAIAAPRTKMILEVLSALQVRGKILIIVDRIESNLRMAARNIEDVEIATANSVHTYQMLCYPVVLITQAALEQLKRRLEQQANGET